MNVALPAGPMTDDAWTPRLATALAGSLAAHLALLVGLALVTGLGASGRGEPFEREPLRATLSSPPPPLPPPPLPPKPPPSPLAPTVTARATAALPVPLRPAPQRRSAPEVFEGRVSIHPDDGGPVDPSIEQAVSAIYPGATRGVPEFDVPPVGIYPEAARRDRVQIALRVVAVVKEDGSVELAEGTFDHPVFGEAIRAALASAKAGPADPANPAARPMWTVLTFHFEHYASGESQRTKYEEQK